MAKIKSVAVFCGSRPGHDPAYLEAATALGRGMASAGLKLVYGGGRVGMMGAVADAVLAGGGAVMGVIPEFLARSEVAHAGVTDMTFTDTMHVRKRLMFDAADAYAILPGGLGTLDELAEIVTWRQLGLHDKPILLADIAGWARPLADLLEFYVRTGFAGAGAGRLYEVVPDIPALLDRLAQVPPAPPGTADSTLI